MKYLRTKIMRITVSSCKLLVCLGNCVEGFVGIASASFEVEPGDVAPSCTMPLIKSLIIFLREVLCH